MAYGSKHLRLVQFYIVCKNIKWYKMKKSIINVIRNLTRNLTFKRSLPNKFGNFSLYVMPRSNILTLNPFNSLAKIGHEELLAATDLLVEPGNVVWDIGANIGLFSVAAAYKTSQSGRVIAIEADDCHTQLLRKTLHLDEKASYVDVICASEHDRSLTLLCRPSEQTFRWYNSLHSAAGLPGPSWRLPVGFSTNTKSPLASPQHCLET